ncbi:unnamed protein product [Rotaria sp. Silwood1]|nr:unnamed protein product [Rotaria sp. Silwood1]
MSTIKTIHQDKLQSLSNIIIKLENTDVTKVVHKTVSCELSDEGHSILSKGLQFCIETKIRDIIESKTDIEMMVINILKQLKEQETKSLDRHISKLLKPVTKDETNVIIKADKESSCVIVHKEPCEIKIKEVLYTGKVFQQMEIKIQLKISLKTYRKQIQVLYLCFIEIKLTEPDYNLAKTSISRRVVLFYQPRICK